MENNNPHNISNQESEEESVIDLRIIFLKFLNNWKIFAVCIILFVIAALVYVNFQSPIYKITGQILIKDDSKNPLGAQNDVAKELNIFSTEKIIDNEIEIFKSYTIMDKVVKKLGLSTNYYKKDGFKNVPVFYSESPFQIVVFKADKRTYAEDWVVKILSDNKISLNGKEYVANVPVYTECGLIKINIVNKNKANFNKEYVFKTLPLNVAVQNYQQALAVSPASKNATVIELSIEDAIPERGIALVDNMIDAYNQAAIDDKNKFAANTLIFLDERLKLITGEVDSVESNVERYKSREGITDVTEESKSFLQTIQETDIKQSEIEIQLGVINNIERYLNSPDVLGGKFPAVFGLDDLVLPELLKQLSELSLSKQALLKTTSEGNPKIQAINENIESLRVTIAENVRNIKQNLLAASSKLKSRSAEFEGVIRNIPAKEKGLISVTRQREIKNSIYEFLSQKREEAALSYASTVSDSRTIDLARSSDKPVKPKKAIIVLMAALLGLILPAVYIGLADVFDDKMGKKADIERIAKAPVLGEISYVKESSQLIVRDKPRSVVSEQIRSLRTNMQYLSNEGHPVQCILFTSSVSGEGKSFISLNLGASLALTESKVVILELDLRKPKLHSALSLTNTNGLSNYLIGKEQLSEIITPITGFGKYDIITSGPIPPNPAELLLNGKLDQLIKELKATYDYVIIDAPPVGLVTDAQIMANYADTTFYITRHNYTQKLHLKNIYNLYREKRFNNMGIIINAISEDSTYGYSYGYGYGYYEEEEGKRGFFGKLFGKKK